MAFPAIITTTDGETAVASHDGQLLALRYKTEAAGDGHRMIAQLLAMRLKLTGAWLRGNIGPTQCAWVQVSDTAQHFAHDDFIFIP